MTSFRSLGHRETRASRRPRLTRAATAFLLLALILPLQVAAEQHAPLLWELGDKDARVYIFGSLHVAPAGIYPLDTRVEDAFGRSDRLVVEIDVTKTDSVALQHAIAERSSMPAGVTLDLIATDYELAVIDEALTASPLDLSDVDSIQPWLIELLAPDTSAASAGLSAANGVDSHFLQRAHERHMPVIELESVEQQMEALAGSSISGQLAWLIAGLVNREVGLGLQYVYELWRAGDVVALDDYLRMPIEYDARAKEVYDRVFLRRNEAWVVHVEQLLAKRGTTFVVVGAGHLAGDGSLVDLLLDRGHRVRRVL